MTAELDPEALGKKLLDLCRSSSPDLTEVERLIAEGGLVDFVHGDRKTPLFLAADQGNEQLVELLLKNKANVNYQIESSGWSPLLTAIQSNHEKVVHLLLEYGADPHLRKDNGATPFIIAAIIGEVRVLQLFLSRGADVNEADDNGFTAFMEAAIYDKEAALRFLFDHKADVNKHREVPDAKQMVCRGGKTALMSAAKKGHENIVNILLDEMHADVNAVDNLGRTALIFALEKHSKSIVETLLKHGACVNNTDNNKETPLSTALKNVKLDSNMVEMLIKYKPDINIPDQDGKTPLILAIENEVTNVVDLLLEDYNADINVQDKSGQSALMAAVNNENATLTKRLCERGADVSCTVDGYTPIMVAKSLYAPEIIKILNQYGLMNINPNVGSSSKWKKCSKRWHTKLEKLQKVVCAPIGNLKLFRNYDFKITTDNIPEVYLGFYNCETEVAVKFHRRFSEKSSTEKCCLAEPKIRASNLFVKLVACETDEHCEYLCLDLYEYNLEEYVRQQPKKIELEPSDIMQQLVKALQILHTAKFAHRDLHPSNVLIDVENRIHLADFDKSVCFDNNPTVKISEGTWEASEILQKLKQQQTPNFEASELFKADLQALGRLLHFLVTQGKDPYESNDDLCENKPSLDKELYNPRNAEVRDFIEGLLAPAETRITLQEAEQHPFLWKEAEKSKFVQDLANEDDVAKWKQDSELVEILNEAGENEERSFHKWTAEIDTEVLDDMNMGQRKKPNMGQSKKPNVKKVYKDTTNDLLKFIRNLTQHFNEKDESIKKLVGSPETYWLCRFPDFIISLYNAVKDTQWNHHFPNQQPQLLLPTPPPSGGAAQDC
ncbi:2-5A-dependent ribonuclease-like [Amblyraja radiata]|uniref:2-5A-dependent ribonuclease-like n=1 Tax=Amblyraja radiata TaxID=386614 RepID=UPI001403723D|nr:2-5A-dependent ribonuclease-like [Amblyraja radiata]